MFKKVLSVIVATCLSFLLAIGFPIQSAYAVGSRINPDDMLKILDDITEAGQAWENIGFDSEDIAEILQMHRKDASYYQSISENSNQLSAETDQTRELENDTLFS